jgi:hypothetical protein
MFGFDLSSLTDLDYILFLAGLLFGAASITAGILIGQSFKRKVPVKMGQKPTAPIKKAENPLVLPSVQADKPVKNVTVSKRVAPPKYLYYVPGVETPFETLKEAVKQYPIDPKYYDRPVWETLPKEVKDSLRREKLAV